MKPLTVGEFQDKISNVGVRWLISEENTEKILELARIGMIPEDEAIRIPHESKWPEWARGIIIRYTLSNTTPLLDDVIKYIQRPSIHWTPKVGDKVFFETEDDAVLIGVLVDYGGVNLEIYKIKSGGVFYDKVLDELKPYNEKYIVDPWDMIPAF